MWGAPATSVCDSASASGVRTCDPQLGGPTTRSSGGPQVSFRPGSVDYEGAMSQRYDSARGLTGETLAKWRSMIAPYVEGRARVLDLGTGTGRFSAPLADWSGGMVVGVEPAEAMRRRAARLAHPRVLLVAGRGEALPLADSTFGAALLSNVFHHLVDRVACARELSRVLEPGARVLVRGPLGDRLDLIVARKAA